MSRFHPRDPERSQRREAATRRRYASSCPECSRVGLCRRSPKEFCSRCAERIWRHYHLFVPIGREHSPNESRREWIPYRGRLKWDDTYLGCWSVDQLYRTARHANFG